MIATLKFNLDNVDDEISYLRCVKAKDMALCLWDIDQYLRGQGKYNDDPTAVTHREELRLILDRYNINLDEILN